MGKIGIADPALDERTESRRGCGGAIPKGHFAIQMYGAPYSLFTGPLSEEL